VIILSKYSRIRDDNWPPSLRNKMRLITHRCKNLPFNQITYRASDLSSFLGIS
jgi:hypothetical protein